MVDVAKAVGADAVAHGCTGKEHSEIRFEPTFFALDPKLIVVAPWREWDSMGSEDAIGHAKKHNVPVPVSNKSINSRDGNLWCRSREGDTSGEENEPKKDTFMLTVNPEDAPHEAESVDIGIVSGIPVSVNGKKLSPASLLTKLNEIGRRHGIGHMDMFGNCLSRAVYETPGVDILFAAARKLESLTMDQETLQVKDSFAQKYADLVNAGRWFDPLRESVDSFMENISRRTTGTVTLKLNKGLITVTSTCT
uniref:argininosuccinate synthase, chloroplastic n=1 Tax=Fragaria vesca subsp. vesca TaxID=101020 RepID=UPI0005CB6458|nr:PREDICTED: argininosuccinate synthase, chloroplastic [Fragaria vesca subsp. vesca]